MTKIKNRCLIFAGCFGLTKMILFYTLSMGKRNEVMLDYHIAQKTLLLELSGNYTAYDDVAQKEKLFQEVSKAKIDHVTIKADTLKQWDSTLVVILFRLIQIANHRKIHVNMSHLPLALQRLLRLAMAVERKPMKEKNETVSFLEELGNWGVKIYAAFGRGIAFLGRTICSVGRLVTGRAIMRQEDFLFALQDCSWKAVPIVSLISFMVGLILAFVGAVQLKLFGAQIYVASLVTIAMTRIMGAIMIGIIMAGRTGASYAATIGTMQVNEEIDALKTMGIPSSDFLVLPRFLALVLTMPLLTMWADFMGMLGGGTVSILMLDIVPQEYIKYSVNAFNLTNFLVGIFHGLIFGCVIALCGCYYGVTCGRDANSVGVATTKAVVSAIVWMIVMTGFITLACEVIGV